MDEHLVQTEWSLRSSLTLSRQSLKALPMAPVFSLQICLFLFMIASSINEYREKRPYLYEYNNRRFRKTEFHI